MFTIEMLKMGKQPSTNLTAGRLAWSSRRRETHRQALRSGRGVDPGRARRESEAKIEGPGLA
jgi:hypothetical protein